MADIKLIGNGLVGSISLSTYYIWLQKFTPIQSGIAKKIYAYTNMADTLHVGIYSDNAGEPGSVLGESAAVYLASSGLIAISNCRIINGNNYWLAVATAGGSICCAYGQSGKTIRYKSFYPYSSAFPNNPTGLASNTTYDISIAAWGSVGGVGLVGDGLVGLGPLVGKGLIDA